MSLFSPLVNRQVGDLAIPSLTMGIVGSAYGLSSLISSPLVVREPHNSIFESVHM